jgi:hypothetical protein
MRKRRSVLIATACFATLCVAGAQSSAAPSDSETRCGWLENPTPGNWWLVDSSATWVMATQGSSQAAGMDRVPDISEREFVRTNGYYGYACGCLRGNFDARERRVVVIQSVRQQALAVCSRDRRLPKP